MEIRRNTVSEIDPPELTWLDTDGKPVAVIDAKYRTVAAGMRGPNSDMRQLTVYCTALGLREGNLIYAKGDAASCAVDIVGADITSYCHALGLTALPVESALPRLTCSSRQRDSARR